jgi:DNA-binding transcriptional LysR family regulator
MEFDSRTLRIFCAVVDASGLQAASGRVALSPSAISRIISQLERDIGVSLFDRIGRRLVPTTTGRRFHARCKEALLLMDDLSAFGRTAAPDAKPPLRVAALSRHAETIVAPAMSALLRSASDAGPVQLEMHAQRDFGFSRLARPFDVGFGNLAAPIEGFETLPLAMSRIVAVLPPDQVAPASQALQPADLAGRRLILLARDTFIGSAVSEILGRDGAPPFCAEVSHTYLALRMVAAGVGIHVTDELAAGDMKRRGFQLAPVSPVRHLVFSAFWPRRTEPLSGRAREAIRSVEAVLADLGAMKPTV